jgi:hypothetical protein
MGRTPEKKDLALHIFLKFSFSYFQPRKIEGKELDAHSSTPTM